MAAFGQQQEQVEQVQVFRGERVEEMVSWLEERGINTASFGHGAAKSVEQLWEEVQLGESTLVAFPAAADGTFPDRQQQGQGQGQQQAVAAAAATAAAEGQEQQQQQYKALRLVSVLNVLVGNAAGQTLIEAEQVLPNGRRRRRAMPLAEKMLPGERWQAAVLRACREELGPVLPADPQVCVVLWRWGGGGGATRAAGWLLAPCFGVLRVARACLAACMSCQR